MGICTIRVIILFNFSPYVIYCYMCLFDPETGMLTTQSALGIRLSAAEQRLYNWHVANLEYGCATALNKLSLVYWDQDDAGMPFEGDHALIKPGFGTFVEKMAEGINIKFNQKVQQIQYQSADETSHSSSSDAPVSLHVEDTLTGETRVVEGDVILCTASLGVLKSGLIDFQPALPVWKTAAIQSLGFGLINKLILEFDTPFWQKKNDQDMFGYLHPGPGSSRGKFYIFWNLHRATGKPILSSLCTGQSAYDMENQSEADLVKECTEVLRKIHSELKVPDPIRTHQTRWAADEFACGSYSFVAAGNNGGEYDELAKNVGNTLFFAGEACNRDYPATVPGAYLSGIRAAGQVQSLLTGWNVDQPGTDVLRELSHQQESQPMSKPDMLATALKQQAVRELQREGDNGNNAESLQFKVAEILARQQRKRRGFRIEAIPNPAAHDAEVDKAQEAQAVSSSIHSSHPHCCYALAHFWL
jgi:hypothetical protein